MTEEMFKTINVRRLAEDEARELSPEDVIYITSKDFPDPAIDEGAELVLVEARLTDTGVEGGFWPVQDVFGKSGQLQVETFGIFMEDTKGELAKLIRQAGTHLDLSLIFPKMTAEEVKERVFKALREEFGAGVIGIVRDAAKPVSAVKYDVQERVVVTTGRGKTRETHEVLNLLAENVYWPQALAVPTKSGGQKVIGVHEPKTQQMPTI